MDVRSSHQTKIPGGSSSSHFCNIVRHAAYKAILRNTCVQTVNLIPERSYVDLEAYLSQILLEHVIFFALNEMFHNILSSRWDPKSSPQHVLLLIVGMLTIIRSEI